MSPNWIFLAALVGLVLNLLGIGVIIFKGGNKLGEQAAVLGEVHQDLKSHILTDDRRFENVQKDLKDLAVTVATKKNAS